jgi:hypothetical protein
MRYITEEELDQMPSRGRGGSPKVFRGIFEIPVGKILLIEPEDWGRKHPPTTVARYIEKHYGRKFETRRILGHKGWAVKRLK